MSLPSPTEGGPWLVGIAVSTSSFGTSGTSGQLWASHWWSKALCDRGRAAKGLSGKSSNLEESAWQLRGKVYHEGRCQEDDRQARQARVAPGWILYFLDKLVIVFPTQVPRPGPLHATSGQNVGQFSSHNVLITGNIRSRPFCVRELAYVATWNWNEKCPFR